MTDREQLAQWMLRHDFSTGHGDTVEDLLAELEWQVTALRSRITNLTADCLTEQQRTNLARAQLGDALADSNRMQWLEDEYGSGNTLLEVTHVRDTWQIGLGSQYISLRAAIDAKRKGD